ncbi:MAG TPA: TorF family putative porin [Aquamicrobium sp.]|jgi:uncharacterized protein (TIGR02001 family)|nr:TorF family putative porin [Aquamicrobium sp.]
MKTIIRTAAFLAAAALSSPALAADDVASQEEIASKFDVAFGVALTSRYISRGVDLSDGPALQAYIEPSYGIFYAGVWLSTIDGDLGGVEPGDDIEFDLYVGIRPEFGSLALDFGYTRFVYDSSGDCCGEFHAKATYTFTEQFSAGGELYYDPDSEGLYGVANAAVVLPYDVTLSGAVGAWLDDNNDDIDWNIGLSYTFNDTVTLDGRYHDSDNPANAGRFVVSLSFDTSWSALRRK